MENLEMVRGDTFSFKIEIDGLTTDLTSASFSVKKNIDDVNYVLQKTLSSGITKNATLSTDTKRVYDITVASTDTNSLAYGDYYYDLQLATATETFTPIRGAFKINWDITR